MGAGDSFGFPPPRKRLGQHFLSDPKILGRIADALAPTASDTVVEIGPGRGALTDVLRSRAARVVAVELDTSLAASLRERYAGDARVTIVEADVRDVDLVSVAGGPFLLAGNVPYYITTPILFQALEPPRASRAVFLVQREVAERLAAPAGHRAYGALSANVQAVARVELMFRVKPGAFHPPPTVESAVVRLTPRADPVVAPGAQPAYRVLVQGAFGLRRKQMKRVIRTLIGVEAKEADDILRRAGIAPDRRPETLAPEEFARLAQLIPPTSA